jgi:hypothetical protein
VLFAVIRLCTDMHRPQQVENLSCRFGIMSLVVLHSGQPRYPADGDSSTTTGAGSVSMSMARSMRRDADRRYRLGVVETIRKE